VHCPAPFQVRGFLLSQIARIVKDSWIAFIYVACLTFHLSLLARLLFKIYFCRMTDPAYEVVIGLEVHAQLLTKSKLFCADNTLFGSEPNTQVSAISLAHPGTLPKLNKEAIRLAVKLGLAMNCGIVRQNYFARKNYFYPDLPKGYQVSQHTTPICKGGYLEVAVAGERKRIRLNRIHIEEDAGKSMHDADSPFSNIDFNRAGMPLVEIVTEPDLRSAEEAYAYVTELRKLVRHLNVCDGNMQEGSLRCDVNISIRQRGDSVLGTKVEIKNLNSVRFIKKAIEFESQRLIDLHKKGELIQQETRGFDDENFTTYSIRVKEDEDDYRYFPEPDLPPFVITDDWIDKIKAELPETPNQVKQRLIAVYNLSDKDAEIISNDGELVNHFTALTKIGNNYKAASNWVLGPIKNSIAENTEATVNLNAVAQLIQLIDEGKISYGIAAQKLFPQLINNPETDVLEYIKENDLFLQSGSDEVTTWIDAALQKHEAKITEYKKGKKGLISVFVGEVMKQSKGRADAKQVTELLTEKLKNN
jgi:aspartyl-tRNA(Asn)/glutamyl-tRNA(Gln) amidotransferase subunit B